MAKSVKTEAFPISEDDPLADAHGDVSAWVEEAVASLGDQASWQDVDLATLPSGQKLLAAKPREARRYAVAALAQLRHWEGKADQIRAQGENEIQRFNPGRIPGWAEAWGKRGKAEAALRALMQRALPFEREDVLGFLQWGAATDHLATYRAPLGAISRAVQRYAAKNPLDEELLQAMRGFAAKLRESHENEAKRLATKIEQLGAGAGEAATNDDAPEAVQPPPQPAPAGTQGVLEELKRRIGASPREAEPTATLIGLDEFSLTDDSPLQSEHAILSELFEEVAGTRDYTNPDLSRLAAGRKLLDLAPEENGRAILAAAERHVHALTAPSAGYDTPEIWQSRYAAGVIAQPLLERPFTLPRAGLFDLLLYLAFRPPHYRARVEENPAACIELAEREAAAAPLSEGERYVLSLFRASLIGGPPLGNPAENVVRLTKLIGDGSSFCLVPGEAWSDAVNDDFTRMTQEERRAWISLFVHAMTATSSRPSAKWLKTAEKLVGESGGEAFRDKLQQWLPRVAEGRSFSKLGLYVGDARGAADTMHDENATCLRGLLWMARLAPQSESLARPITAVALSAYKKVPGVGPRAVKVGNAGVFALSEIGTTEAVGQLAMLKVRVKFGTAQKEIEKAFTKAAESLGLPRDEIEEMGVPSYGLEEDGRRSEALGDYQAKLLVTGTDAGLRWSDAKGKPLKSVPAKVKKEHKDELKELQQSLKDIQGMLPAQRDRIDGMFLLQKSWPIEVWRERYLEHPLVGTIARRLLWCVDGEAALFLEGKPTDVRGEPIAHGRTAEITLWHPVGRSIEEITAWRRRLEELEITQPFKQAHREVYLLTDAERRTHAYSNRYAAHIIRQHQFNALCAARGWKNRLRLMVDDAYAPPSKDLPRWNLRAEFWVEGIGDGYGTDTNESGVYLRLATDQVRFYRREAAANYAHASGGGYVSGAAGPGDRSVNEPLPLEEIPPLVFSEIMRDVDLFVGVASVGNDPTWQDGGPEGRYRDYWHSYSFGELSGTAATRKQVLERLVPRLKIAGRCSFSDRFLVVRGDKRTYKIHLGSGNILMAPNDQYLCIVPDSRARAKQDDLFLPFEGDGTLSIILSKALLLAEDTKIKDPTITRQIDT